MKEYRKIKNLFEFDANFKAPIGLNLPFKFLKDLEFIGTEKVDGTNVRIIWDGHEITFKGRKENSQFQGNLESYLISQFKTTEMEYLFEQVFEDKEVIIFGEGYGPRIQTNGELYSDVISFIVFDIDINGYHLSRENIIDICKKLNLDYVPIVFKGNILEAYNFIKKHPFSTLNKNHEMEGIVLELPFELYDKNGERLKCKCKWRDVKRIENINSLLNV